MKALSLLKRTGADAVGETAEAQAVCRRIDKAKNWIDFDDLIGLSIEVLRTDATTAARWRERFRHISVDEFQDVDEQQYKLIRLLAEGQASLCVIGDPNQAIYGFRGADAACFQRLAQDFPAAHRFELTRNYRSTAAIVAASAQVIGATSARGGDAPVRGADYRCMSPRTNGRRRNLSSRRSKISTAAMI